MQLGQAQLLTGILANTADKRWIFFVVVLLNRQRLQDRPHMLWLQLHTAAAAAAGNPPGLVLGGSS